MAGGGEMANAFVELGDKLHKNINQSIGTIGSLANAKRSLAENQRQFDKTYDLEKFLAMVQARESLNKQGWQRGFRNALMGR